MVEPFISKSDAEPGEIEASETDDLPVVARMVVEIRSDGTRTIARGAIEDNLNGQKVGVEARADSPLELARALTKMVLSTPFTALLGSAQASPQSDGGSEDGSRLETGVRAKVGALGRRLGQRLDDRLRDRGLNLPGRGRAKR